MIQLFHVYKSYGKDKHALADITLEIEKGEFTFLTGPSGAGKSTFLKLLFCAEMPTSGQVMVNGHNTSRLRGNSVPYLRLNIGVVFQDFKLLPRRTVAQNVAITLQILGRDSQEVHRRSFNILKEVGLGHKMNELPDSLSGGEQQRVAIARALVGDPQILIADEPTGNLDAERAKEILNLLEYANSRGTTVLLATHDRTLLESHRGRVIRLDRGRLAGS